MPAAVPWSEEELQQLVLTSSESRVFLEQKRIPVVLQPFHLNDLKSAVRDLLNASIDSYDKSLDGVLLNYKHLKVLSRSASVSAESSGVLLDIQADFFVFRPEVGCVLRGVVNKISKDHIGVLLYQRFNVSCPRPSSDARSEKWLGNSVVMHQEVTFKLKEKNFSGRLPFFKGKLISCGMVLAEMTEEENKISKKKKKKKEKGDETSILCEPLNSPSTPASKILKHKLDEPDVNVEVKVKKSKKEAKLTDTNPSTEQVLNEKSTSKKKSKKEGIRSETDFIPRFSLDVSQLPDHLPPPNADSTHVDFRKSLPSLSTKAEKRKRVHEKSLSLVGEESTMTSDVFASTADQNPGEKSKKKKEKRKKENPEDVPIAHEQTVLGGKALTSIIKNKKGREINNVSSLSTFVEANPNSLIEKSKKKKKKGEDFMTDDQSNVSSKLKKSKKDKDNITSSLVESSIQSDSKLKHLKVTSPPRVKHTQEKELLASSSSPTKKKESTSSFTPEKSGQNIKHWERKTSAELLNDSKGVEGFKTTPKSKKEKKEREENIPFTSVGKKSKKGEELDDLGMASDDTIPPGQKALSPRKQKSAPDLRSPSAVSIDHSSNIGYFPSSCMADLDLGIRKGARPAQRIFGSLEGMVLPPPESPLKLSPEKKIVNSDSEPDIPSPKKIVVASSLWAHSSDSEDSKESESKGKSVPLAKSGAQRKNSRESTDESDLDYGVKSKLLQSMGVMQSPLKTAKQTMKQSSSESDSDESINIKTTLKVKPDSGKASKFQIQDNLKVNSEAPKPNSSSKTSKLDVSNITPSPSKTSVSKHDSSPKKTQSPLKQEIQTPKRSLVLESFKDDSDSDLDIEEMKRALLNALPKKPAARKPAAKKPPAEESSAEESPAEEPAAKKPAAKKPSAKETLAKKPAAKKPNTGEEPFRKPPAKKPPAKKPPAIKSTVKVKQPAQPLNVETEEKVSNKSQGNASQTSVFKSHGKSLADESSDSDSGPDDRNTTAFLEMYRQTRAAQEKFESQKKSRKSIKSKKEVMAESLPVAEEKKDPIKTKKEKYSKVNKKPSEEKKPKQEKKPKEKEQKKKKKSTDDEISAVMQRLLKQAKLDIGLK